jgi:PAS domain S-box-containing protein
MSLKTFEHSILPDGGACDSARAIRAEERSFRNLTDHLSQIVSVVSSQGNGRYFNACWKSFTGLSERESLDFGWMRAFHHEDLDGFIKVLRRSSAQDGGEFEARLKRADGSYRRHLCRCSLLADQPDGTVSLVICCTDVEEWRQAEAVAKEQSALLGLSLRTHDEEKRKIAHGLHDSAGQYLIALQMKLDSLQRSSVAATGRKNPVIDDCRELIKRCYREIRGTSHLLYPPLLDDLGLEAAVHLHVDRFMERAKIKVETDIEPNLGRLDRDLEIALFRVVQEALATIHRQSAGNNVQIKIGAVPTSIFAEVTASGGTDGLLQKFMPSPRTTLGVGLATLRQRILEVGGLFEIASPADGIAIRAVVPRRALVAHACD